MLIDIDKIIVGDRIRKDFGDIEELAYDIEENTLLNALVVTPSGNGDGTYLLIAGERRLRACKMLGYRPYPSTR
ncbi:MAG: ParB N-terminal domain-containing protein [Oscillospiraceae bacterium]|nr:ParB N-terminal domain-containing protein [Oscillospiraceae bacterium]